jgi:hypothetical protein
MIVGLIAFILLLIAISTNNHQYNHHHHSRYKLVIFFNNQNKYNMAQTLTVAQVITSHLGVVDHVTGASIPATFANETVAIADPTLLSVTTDADGNEVFTGVAVGTTDVTISADCTYIDGNTNESVTVNKSVTVSLTINQPTEPEATDLVVTFS